MKDLYGRVTSAQGATYNYDGSSGNTQGRLASIVYANGAQESFEYTTAGLPTKKTLTWTNGVSLIGQWGYDNEGRMTYVKYPDTARGPTEGYTTNRDRYEIRPTPTNDTMGRLSGMKDHVFRRVGVREERRLQCGWAD